MLDQLIPVPHDDYDSEEEELLDEIDRLNIPEEPELGKETTSPSLMGRATR